MKTNLIQKSKPARHCVLILVLFGLHFSAFSQLKIDYGKSYVNLTKGTIGGTIEPGDTLQIRATFVVGGSGTNDYVDSCAYFDVIPGNSVYVPYSLCVLTNEGKIY